MPTDQAPGTGYSGRPLAAKLGIKEGAIVCLLGAPPGFEQRLRPLPEGVTFRTALAAPEGFVHAFVTDRATLALLLPRARTALRPDGVLWVSWPKRSSGVHSDVREDVVREIALPLGLVDVKVAAVDATWSALKLVIRRALRVAP